MALITSCYNTDILIRRNLTRREYYLVDFLTRRLYVHVASIETKTAAHRRLSYMRESCEREYVFTNSCFSIRMLCSCRFGRGRAVMMTMVPHAIIAPCGSRRSMHIRRLRRGRLCLLFRAIAPGGPSATPVDVPSLSDNQLLHLSGHLCNPRRVRLKNYNK